MLGDGYSWMSSTNSSPPLRSIRYRPAADRRIWPIDWEVAGVGDPMLDVAALVTRWDDDVTAGS